MRNYLVFIFSKKLKMAWNLDNSTVTEMIVIVEQLHLNYDSIDSINGFYKNSKTFEYMKWLLIWLISDPGSEVNISLFIHRTKCRIEVIAFPKVLILRTFNFTIFSHFVANIRMFEEQTSFIRVTHCIRKFFIRWTFDWRNKKYSKVQRILFDVLPTSLQLV